MKKLAKPGHIWVWTELTESLRGIKYPAEIERRAGEPVYEHYRTSCPTLWVEKGYVREMLVVAEVEAYGNDCRDGRCEW